MPKDLTKLCDFIDSREERRANLGNKVAEFLREKRDELDGEYSECLSSRDIDDESCSALKEKLTEMAGSREKWQLIGVDREDREPNKVLRKVIAFMKLARSDRLTADMPYFREQIDKIDRSNIKNPSVKMECLKKKIQIKKYRDSHDCNVTALSQIAETHDFDFGRCYEEVSTMGDQDYKLYFKVSGGQDPELAPVGVGASRNNGFMASGSELGVSIQTATIMSAIAALSSLIEI